LSIALTGELSTVLLGGVRLGRRFFSALGVVGIDAKPARQNVQERDLAARPGWHGWDHRIWSAR
jgi:hypothetical protein